MSWTGDARRDVADVMRLLYERGLVQVRGGNASIREGDHVYMSPSGVPRTLLAPRDVALVSMDGRVLEGRPTSEWRMHLAVYRARPEARAVVHAHPRSLLALLASGGSLDPGLMSEAGIQVSCVSRVPWLRPGSRELAEAVGSAVEREACNVVVLERHGVLVWSPHTIYHALDLLEAVEDLAWLQLHSSRCGPS